METHVQIKNSPEADALWKGIGGYFDSLGEILCEFIDNSISNFIGNKVLSKSILLSFQNLGDTIHITVEDSGTGIKDLNSAMTLGCTEAKESPLNEHGFGFKHALASANPSNNNWSISTCTNEMANSNKYLKISNAYRFENYQAKVMEGWAGKLGSRTGTIIDFECTRDMFNTIRRGLRGNFTHMKSLLDVLAEDLGFIYAGILNGNVAISIEMLNGAGVQEELIAVEAVTPNWAGYYDPKPGKIEYDLGGGQIELYYEFGKVNENPDTKRYYKRNMSTSGLEIRINGRILAYNLFKEVWGIEPHPSYNQLLICINLESNNSDALPKTKTSKNGLREGDARLVKLIDWVRSQMANPPKSKEIDPEDLDERELFQRLSEAKIAHLPDPKIVKTEQYAYNTLNEKIRIDLYVSCNGNTIIYEGKKDKTTVKDIYQLLMYWDGCVMDGNAPTEGVLISSVHPESVKKIVPIINEQEDANGNKYNIKLKTWIDENIHYPY